jgi:hypothetical protein
MSRLTFKSGQFKQIKLNAGKRTLNHIVQTCSSPAWQSDLYQSYVKAIIYLAVYAADNVILTTNWYSKVVNVNQCLKLSLFLH